MDILADFLLGYVDWIAAFFSLTAIALAAKKNILCWPLFLLGNVGFLIHSIPRDDWAYVFLFSAYFLFNLYGWYQWAKDRRQEA